MRGGAGQPTNGGLALVIAISIVTAAIYHLYRLVSSGQSLGLAVQVALAAILVSTIALLIRYHGVSRV